MNRLPDWRARLLAYVRSLQGVQYDAKQFHCVHFMCGAVEAMTGDNLMAPYDAPSQAASMRLLRAAGYRSWVDVLSDRRVPPAKARAGDVVAVRDHNGRKAAGICMGADLHVLGPAGLSTLPRAAAIEAFAI